MDEDSLNEVQMIDDERKKILEEMGPTYYEIVGVPTNDEEIFEFIKKELKEVEEIIDKIQKNESGNSQVSVERLVMKYSQYRGILNNIQTLQNNGKDRNYIISQIALYQKGIYHMERSVVGKKLIAERNGENNPERIRELEDEFIEIEEKLEILSVLGNREKKEAYDAELERKFEEIKERRRKERIEKLEQQKREELKRNRMLRKSTESEMIAEELGESFNPDRSREKFKDSEYRSESKENPLAKWVVELYPEKKLLFDVNTNNQKYPELNQKVTVYRYGTFEFQTLFNNGKPTKEDRTCEIIGVKKVDIEGNEEETFLIAQTMEAAYMEKMTMGKVLELRNKGVKVSIVESQEDVRRNARKAERERRREEQRSPLEKFILKVKNAIKSDEPESKEIDLDEEKEVLVFEKRMVSLTPEETERLSRIYLSDYLIDNAIQNNSRYIGSLKHPEYDLDADALRIASYAEKRSGVIVDRMFSNEGSISVNARNIEDVFTMIRNREKGKITPRPTERNVAKRPEGKIIKFPTLDD